MKLIDKDAVVAVIDEIVRGLQKNCNPNPMGNMLECLAAAQIEVVNLIKDSLDTLEVKEVDFETELDEWIKTGPHTSYPWCDIPDAIKITAEHFFELGIAVSNKVQKGE